MNKPTRKSTIRISSVNEKNKSAILELAKIGHAESMFREFPFSETKFNMGFDKCIQESHKNIGLKANMQDRVVGFLYCTLGSYFVSDEGLIASVGVVYVDKEVRGTMIGGKVGVKLTRVRTHRILKSKK